MLHLLKNVVEKEVEQEVDTIFQPAMINCKVFEDNSRALQMMKLPKIKSQRKYLNNNYHHFCKQVKTGEFKIGAVAMEEQLTDIS